MDGMVLAGMVTKNNLYFIKTDNDDAERQLNNFILNYYYKLLY